MLLRNQTKNAVGESCRRITRSMTRLEGERKTFLRFKPYKLEAKRVRRVVKLVSDDDFIACLRENIVKSQKRSRINYLLKPKVLDWCFPSSTFSSRLDAEREKRWGTRVIGYNTNQWTTKLGESILEEALGLLGRNPVRIRERKNGENGKDLVPDFETDEALYECKARTYTTTGTAGEKILGTPWKYSECKHLYGKPFYLVCLAFQENEATSEFCVFDTTSGVRRRMLDFYEKEAGVKYIKFTDLLKEILNSN